jgi:hypothetical protein
VVICSRKAAMVCETGVQDGIEGRIDIELSPIFQVVFTKCIGEMRILIFIQHGDIARCREKSEITFCENDIAAVGDVY